jgi:hypothetical protein
VSMDGENNAYVRPVRSQVREGCAVLILESSVAQCPTCRGEAAERVMRMYSS